MDINSIRNTIFYHKKFDRDIEIPQLSNEIETLKIIVRRIELKQCTESNKHTQIRGNPNAVQSLS